MDHPKIENPKFIIAASVFVMLLFCIVSAFAATPVGKTWQESDAVQVCPDGRRGTKCFGLATITLTWETPVEREDGSPLPFSEISHYVITQQRNTGPVTSIAVARSNIFVLRHMPAGTYTFAIATVDSDGFIGNFSSSIQETIN